MKTRFALIITVGALALAIFENWRFRTSTKNFKELFEDAAMKLDAYRVAHLPFRDLFRPLQESGLLESQLKFEDSSLTSTAHESANRQFLITEWAFKFNLESPLEQDERKKLEKIINDLQGRYPGQWGFQLVESDSAIVFRLLAGTGELEEEMSAFKPMAREVDLSEIFPQFKAEQDAAEQPATAGESK